MKIRKQQYTFTWIALASVVLAATALLLLPSFRSLAPAVRSLLSFFAWGLAVIPAIFLFLSGSRGALVKMIHTKEGDTSPTATIKKSPSEQEEKKALDLYSLAGKITRRIDPVQPPEKWGQEWIDMLVSEIEIMTGIFYYRDQKDRFTSVATYATPHGSEPLHFKEGEGLNGQAARNGRVEVIRNISDQYGAVFSGLGSAKPAYLALIPIVTEGRTTALLEVAGFRWADDQLEQLFQIIADHFSEKMMAANKEDNTAKQGPGTR